MSESRRTLLLIATVGMLPVLASVALFNWWQPSGRMNHGELLETRSAVLEKLQSQLKSDSAQPLASVIKRKWVLLTIQAANCDVRCQKKLYLMRQVRTAQNENMLRIERLWVISDAGQPESKLLEVHPGLHLAKPTPQWMANLPPGGDAGAYIYLIDPLGNFVLRYGDSSEPKGMLKDLRRLLKYSSIG